MPYTPKLFSSEPPMPTAIDDMMAKLDAETRLRRLMEDIRRQSADIRLAPPEMPEYSQPEPGLMDRFPMDAMGMDTGLTKSPIDGSWGQYKKAPPKEGAYVGQRRGRG